LGRSVTKCSDAASKESSVGSQTNPNDAVSFGKAAGCGYSHHPTVVPAYGSKRRTTLASSRPAGRTVGAGTVVSRLPGADILLLLSSAALRGRCGGCDSDDLYQRLSRPAGFPGRQQPQDLAVSDRRERGHRQ